MLYTVRSHCKTAVIPIVADFLQPLYSPCSKERIRLFNSIRMGLTFYKNFCRQMSVGSRLESLVIFLVMPPLLSVCLLLSDVCLTSDVCRVHREYSWRPQLCKARWAPQARRVWAGAGPQRAARTGAGHIVAASRLQLVFFLLMFLNGCLAVQLTNCVRNFSSTILNGHYTILV